MQIVAYLIEGSGSFQVRNKSEMFRSLCYQCPHGYVNETEISLKLVNVISLSKSLWLNEILASNISRSTLNFQICR